MARVPREYLLYPTPLFQTAHGDFLTDAESVKLVMDEFLKEGVSLPVFFDHPEDDVRNKEPAAGFFDMEPRVEGIWAINLRWSNTASEQLADGGWAFHSPEFLHSTEDGQRVVKVLADSLVHEPATYNQRPITAAKNLPEGVAVCRASATKMTAGSATGGNPFPQSSNNNEDHIMDEKTLRQLGVKDDAEAVAVFTRMKSDAEKSTKDIEVVKTEAAKAKANLETSDALITSVMEAVECDDRTALVGKCKKCKDDATKVAELTKEVETSRTKTEEAEKAALIEAAGLGEDKVAWLKKQTIATVKSYVEDCAKVKDVDTTPQSASAKKGNSDKPDEWFVEMCKGKGMDEAKTLDEWKSHLSFKAKHPRPQYGNFAPDSDEG